MQYISQTNYFSIEGEAVLAAWHLKAASAPEGGKRLLASPAWWSRRAPERRLCLLLQEACRSRRRSTGVEGGYADSAGAQAKVAVCRPTLLLADRATLGLARG